MASLPCGRPQGRDGVQLVWMYVDREKGGQKPDFLWMSQMDDPI